jgi:hypothetical protein
MKITFNNIHTIARSQDSVIFHGYSAGYLYLSRMRDNQLIASLLKITKFSKKIRFCH